MSSYKIGCLVPVSGHAFEKQDYQVGVGALIATPGYILDQIRALNSEIMAHDREIATQAGISGYGVSNNPELQNWWRSVWLPFIQEWSRFRNDHQSWTDNMWGSVNETTDRYRSRLKDLRRSARETGFQFGTPEPREPEEGLGSMVRGIGGFVKNVTYATLILFGGYMFLRMRR